MTPDEIKNNAIFAGGIGALVRLAVVKPKSILVGATSVLVGGVCSWFLSPVASKYIFRTVLEKEDFAALSFAVGFISLYALNYAASLLTESKGNPFRVWIVIKDQITGKTKPNENEQPPTV